MIVICIVAVVFAIGVPSLFRTLQKDAMRQAVSDVLEACQHARAEAILHDTTTEMRFDLLEGGIWELTVAVRPKHRQDLATEPGTMAVPAPEPPVAAAPIFKVQFSERIMVDLLGVNFKDAIADKESPAPVRFYANGTCD
jgi:type II secretory pathway pseudopilin PulG